VEGALSLATTAALFDALGIQASLDLRAPLLADRQRQLEPARARCVAYAQRRYERAGCLTAREVDISYGRSHGWIDLLAFDPRSGALAVNEIKTEIEDEGRIERTMGWYERAAWEVARNLGWRPRLVVGCLLLLDSERNHERIRGNREALATGFPVRAFALTSWLGGPRRPWPAPARALALVDPLSRREAWLRATTRDGRRTPAPFEDYADFMRRLRGRSHMERHKAASVGPSRLDVQRRDRDDGTGGGRGSELRGSLNCGLIGGMRGPSSLRWSDAFPDLAAADSQCRRRKGTPDRERNRAEEQTEPQEAVGLVQRDLGHEEADAEADQPAEPAREAPTMGTRSTRDQSNDPRCERDLPQEANAPRIARARLTFHQAPRDERADRADDEGPQEGVANRFVSVHVTPSAGRPVCSRGGESA
jgi:hypothetical protein